MMDLKTPKKNQKAHRKVQCWIFSEDPQGKILCLLLLTNKARGSYWQPVTGTVEEGEGFFEAACREPFEETQFTFTSTPIDTGFEFEYESRFGATKERIFGLIVESVPVPKLDPNEHQNFQWINLHDALDLLKFPSNAEGLKKTFEILFKKKLGSKTK